MCFTLLQWPLGGRPWLLYFPSCSSQNLSLFSKYRHLWTLISFLLVLKWANTDLSFDWNSGTWFGSPAPLLSCPQTIFRPRLLLCSSSLSSLHSCSPTTSSVLSEGSCLLLYLFCSVSSAWLLTYAHTLHTRYKNFFLHLHGQFHSPSSFCVPSTVAGLAVPSLAAVYAF